VECVFADYLFHADPACAEHHVLVTHGLCHPSFRPTLKAHAVSVHHAKYWHGLKIPRAGGLRQRHLLGAFAAVKADVVFLRNCLGDLDLVEAARDAVIVCSEHGAAWGEYPERDVARFLARMTGVVCNSRASQRMLELRWQAESARILVRHNPVRSDVAAAAVVRRQGLRTPLRLGIIGRMVPFKGFPLALHAVRHLLRDGVACRLDVAGTGHDEEALLRLARKLSLDGHVRFCGVRASPARFYEDIDVLLCPSIREPFGNVAIEAACTGCPVVAAAVDGLPEAVQHGRTGLCVQPSLPVSDYPELGGSLARCPRWVYDPLTDALQRPRLVDPRALADAVKGLVQRPERWQAMSDEARRCASQGFRMADYASWVDRYLQAVAQRGS